MIRNLDFAPLSYVRHVLQAKPPSKASFRAILGRFDHAVGAAQQLANKVLVQQEHIRGDTRHQLRPLRGTQCIVMEQTNVAKLSNVIRQFHWGPLLLPRVGHGAL